MKRQVLMMLSCGLLLVASSPSWAREWTDNTGKYSVEAELVESQGGQVTLRKPDGSVVVLPIARLSKADQRYLQSLGKPGSQRPDDSPATQSAVLPRDEKLAAELEKGSIVSIRAGGQPVGSVLAQIEKATGNRVRIIGDFDRHDPQIISKVFSPNLQGIPDDEQVLSKRVSLNLQEKPFWEAIDALAAAAGVEFGSILNGTMVLSTEVPRFDRIKVVGAPTVVGAFRVYPAFDDSSGNAMIVVRLEPRFGEPQVRSYQAEITLPGGKQIQYKPDSTFRMSKLQTMELALRIKPDLPKGTKKAEEIKFEARLAIASHPKAFTLPPLGELVPKPVTVGNGAVDVRVTREGLSSAWQFLKVDLLVEGVTLDPKNIVLVDIAGNRIMSLSLPGIGQGDRQVVGLLFPRQKISGDPGKCRLALKAPGTSEKTIGPLETLLGQSVPAGATIVRLIKAHLEKQPDGTEPFNVIVEFDGFPASLDGVTLVGPDGRPLEPTERSGMSKVLGFGYRAGFSFNPAQILGKAESYRLRLHAPTMVTEHVLRATFSDVPLAKDE